jgi:hypothetical protein
MATRTYELYDSREVTNGFDGPSARLKFRTLEAADEIEAIASVSAVAPSAFNGLPLKTYTLTPLGGGAWTTEANYAPKDSAPIDGQGNPADPPESPGEPAGDEPLTDEYSFDTSGGTIHITQSVATREAKGRDGDQAADFGRAIGVSKDGVAGTDVISPKLEFSVTKEVEYVTLDYVRVLRDLTATTNKEPFLGFQAGEVLFTGAKGSRQGGPWKVQYSFLTAKNRDLVVIVPGANANDPPILSLPNVRGHDYVWVTYEDAEDEGELIQRPRAAYAEQVYEEGDFTKLGIT